MKEDFKFVLFVCLFVWFQRPVSRRRRVNQGITEVGAGKLSAVTGLSALDLSHAQLTRQREYYKHNRFIFSE